MNKQDSTGWAGVFSPAPLKKTIQDTIKKSLSFLVFFVTLVGLVMLLILPLANHYQYERSRNEVDSYIEPARFQIGQALENAHELRGYLILRDYLKEKTSYTPYPSSQAYVRAHLAELKRQSEQETWLRRCGPAALEEWRRGTADLRAYFQRQKERKSLRSADPRATLLADDALFESGVEHLWQVRRRVDAVRDHLLETHRASSLSQIRLAIFLGLLCILLSSLAGWNLQRLGYLSARAQESAAQLRIAVNEIDDRVRNNLQIITALVELQRKDNAPATRQQALENIAAQVRAVTAVHAITSTETHVNSVRSDRLMERLITMYQSDTLMIRQAVEPVFLSLKQATSLSLIVNELLLYAARCGAKQAALSLHPQGERIRFSITHDGLAAAGPESVCGEKIGLMLVATLVHHDLMGEVISPPEDTNLLIILFPG